MKFATFNINNINKRLENLLASPDVVSLQELKSEQQAFPAHAIRRPGYESVWQGERPKNNVILAFHSSFSRQAFDNLRFGSPNSGRFKYLFFGSSAFGLLSHPADVRIDPLLKLRIEFVFTLLGPIMPKGSQFIIVV